MAAAILGKLKPNAASAILDEMETERANRLVGAALRRPTARARNRKCGCARFRCSLPRSRSAAAGTAPASSCANRTFPRSGRASSPARPPPSRARTVSRQPPSPASPPSLYAEPRITHVGDIVTVIIAINDKATLGNSSGRSQTTKDGLAIDYGFNNGSASSSSSQPAKIVGDLASTSSSQGQGSIDRSEQIQVSVAAVVTRVLPNGNLVISGSQEVRVNYELRQLTVAGIVRPSDVSLNNTIAYDHIAEARISYGGRGRQSDVQQPSWGQQVYDAVKPF